MTSHGALDITIYKTGKDNGLLPVHGHNNALSNDDFDFIYFDDSHEDTMDVINDE